MEKTYSLQQVAEMLRYDIQTIRRWLKRGLLAAFRHPGGRWQVRESEILRIIGPEALANKLYTLDEVAGTMGYNYRTVHEWARSGKLKVIKMPGGTWRVSQSVVNQAMGG